LSSGLPVLWLHASCAHVNHRQESAQSLSLVPLVLLAEHVVQQRQELLDRQLDDPPPQVLDASAGPVRR
jgi:hypothetical protein